MSGQIELIVADIRLDVATPRAGDTVNILVTIENASDGPARPSNLALYLNDLNESPWPTAPKALVQVGEFTASERRVVSVPWTIPASGGNFAIWGWADALHEIGEVTDFNNISHTSIRIAPDAAVAGFSPSATETVELDVINYSARQNVRVRSGVVNHGQAPLHEVRVDLYWSHEGGAYELIGNQTVGNLAPGEHAPLQWNVDGWAGTNRYRVTIVTPTGQLDADQTDNVGESQLYLAGLADLRIAEAALADGPYVQSATLIVTATIENDGAALAEEFAVEVFAKTFDDGALRVGRAIVQRLVPHQSATLSLPLAT
ncbi:MAG TPA: hypothetical protein PLV92_29575, partial [Pirellulaceae bacterium]|nr:hypothetical protein [Pirellulaceae bacterium]